MQKSQMNVFSVAAIGIGAMVGAGIFALLGQVIIQASSLSYISFIISGVAAMFSGYSYAKLSAYLPLSGGITAYYRTAFPNRYIFGILSLIYLFTLMISIAMLGKSFAMYTLGVFDILSISGLEINFVALLLIVFLTMLNLQSSGQVGRAELFLVGTKLLILLVLIAAVLFRPDLKFDNSFEAPEQIAFMGSIGITFFAYAGFGTMVNAAKDVSNPQKNIPIAIYLAIGLVIALYLTLTYIVLNFIPQNEIMQSANTAVAVVASKVLGPIGKYLLSAAALIAFVSGINAMFFSSYKIITALSEHKALPNFINYKLTKSGTIGGALASILIMIAIVTFDFKAVVNISSGAFLVSYLAVFLVNWKLRHETNSSPIVILLGTLLMLIILVSFLISIIE